MTRKERIRSIYAGEDAPTPTDRPSLPPIPSIQIAGIDSSKLGLIQESAYETAADFTTTNTTDWQTLNSFAINVPGGNVAVACFAMANVSHSAAAAEVSIDAIITVDDVGATSYQIAQAQNYYLATANKKALISFAMIYNVPVNLPLLIPGRRTVTLRAFNHSVGTLTVHSNGLVRGIFAFIAGDQT